MGTIRNETVVQDYIDAWEAHDSDAIVDTFGPGGTYRDPTTSGELTGEAIGDYAAGLWEAVPDLSFDVERLKSTVDDFVLYQWTMRGTQEGSLEELPPTGERFELPGVDVIEVGDNGITSIRGYFDPGSMLAQLGHRVDVQPEEFGPVSFGVSARLDLEKKTEPGAFSLTTLYFRDAEDEEAISDRVQDVITEMIEMDGVISAIATRDGERGNTITAWDEPEDARRLMREGSHREAVEEMFETDGLGEAGMTSIWTLERMNGRMLRCEECRELTYEVEADTCPECDAPLPAAPAYW